MITLRKLTHGAAAAALVGLGALPATAQEIGDAKAGRAFAAKHCTECHAIEPGEATSPNRKAPNFTTVAKTSGMTGRALAAWFDTSHPTMPNFVLRAGDRDDVIAYILSLKTAPDPK